MRRPDATPSSGPARPRPPQRRAAAFALLTLALAGCAPQADQSGWEMARRKTTDLRVESYPELPVVLPGPALQTPPVPTGSPLEGVREQRLDAGSLFRRGFSAPTP